MIINKIDQLINENGQLKANIDKLKNEVLTQNEADTSIKLIGINFDAKIYEDLLPKDLKSYAEKLLNSKKLDIVCILSKFNNKVSSVVTINKAIIKKFNAVELVNIISENVEGGKGGGRPDMAQAGGQNIKKIDTALEKLKQFIKNKE